MTPCGICRSAEAIHSLESAIGGTPVCWTCFDARAETPVALHEAYQELDRMERGSRQWRAYRAFLRPATCFDGWDTGYVPHIRFLEQKVEQLPARVERAEEEATARDLVRKMQAAKEPREITPVRSRWSLTLRWIAAFFIPEWETA